MKTTYCYSADEEDCFVGSYATREEALTVGIDVARDEEHASVFTARCGAAARASRYLNTNAIDNLIDALIDSASDAGAESACPDWLGKVTRDQKDDLQDRVAAAVDMWAEQHGHTPNFWHVEDVQEHAVRAEAEAT